MAYYYLALHVSFADGSCAVTATIFVISWPFLAPVITAHPTFSFIFLELDANAATKNFVVTVIDGRAETKPPHRVPGGRTHQPPMTGDKAG